MDNFLICSEANNYMNKKIKLLNELLLLTIKQADIISQDNIDELSVNIHERQGCIYNLEKLECEVDSIPDLSIEEQKLLRKIQELDYLNIMSAKNKCDEYAAKIKELNLSKTLRSYESKVGVYNSHYFDKKK